MRKRVALAILLGTALALSTAPSASAHGERAQEAFLRMRTIAWIDVQFSDTTVQQGEEITLTGTAKLMNTWPDTLAAGEPRIGFVNVIAPGPVVLLRERTVNGVSAPGRIEVAKGEYYEFEMTIAGRRPGRWHLHPAFAVKGAGTVLGPGEFVTVEENPDGFTNPVTLYNGSTINLENYGIWVVWWWQIITMLIGLGWMLYWTVPKFHRTVSNLAITSQIPLNDDGVEVGLNSQRDHRVVNLFALGTALLLLAGFLWQAAAYPVKIPQQVVQFAPPTLEPYQDFASATPVKGDFDVAAGRLTMELDVTNQGQSPMQLTEFNTSTLTFSESSEADAALQVSPATGIGPGETSTLTVTVEDPVFAEEHLLPVGEAQLTVAGLLVFEDSSGQQSTVEIDVPIRPTFE
jgi:methane/ammonia monooxygenase subunit B